MGKTDKEYLKDYSDSLMYDDLGLENRDSTFNLDSFLEVENKNWELWDSYITYSPDSLFKVFTTKGNYCYEGRCFNTSWLQIHYGSKNYCLENVVQLDAIVKAKPNHYLFLGYQDEPAYNNVFDFGTNYFVSMYKFEKDSLSNLPFVDRCVHREYLSFYNEEEPIFNCINYDKAKDVLSYRHIKDNSEYFTNYYELKDSFLSYVIKD